MQRRLTTIMAADIAGFSRLVGIDEEGTLAARRRHRMELIDPLLDIHHGRVANTAGDSLLIEFPSPVEAVRFALAIQEGMAARNAYSPADRRLEYRIGINVGDVVAEDGDLLGDGVNIAARLEGLAPPGGICLSNTTYDQIRDRLKIVFADMGEVTVKNIARPIKFWRWPTGESPDAVVTTTAKVESLALPEKPSIAVLPFENMGGDPEQDYFGDGIAEDIITALSRIQAFFVTARNSSFTYKGKAVEVTRIGRELGVGYVLEGSVRKSGPRLRVTAQLIDAQTSHHIWADRYDRQLIDMFEIQDEITQNVVASTQTQIQIREGSYFDDIERPSLPVWALVNKVWKLIYEMTPESLNRGRQLAEEAVALEPRSARAQQVLASTCWHLYWLRVTDAPDRTIRDARLAAEQALRLNEGDEYAHWICGLIAMVSGQYDKGIAELERAIEINPNCSLAYGSLGTVLNHAGEPQKAIEKNLVAIRANPLDPSIFFRHAGLGLSYFLLGEYGAAVEWARKSVLVKPSWYLGHVVLAAAYSELGRATDAEGAIEDYLRNFPGASIEEIERIPFRFAEHREKLTGALRRANFPTAG